MVTASLTNVRRRSAASLSRTFERPPVPLRWKRTSGATCGALHFVRAVNPPTGERSYLFESSGCKYNFGYANDGIGGFQGYWEGSTETGLYFYGTSLTEMQARSAAFIASYPLCQKVRIVQIA